MAMKRIKKDDATDAQLRQYGEELLGLNFPVNPRRTDLLAMISQVDDSEFCVVEQSDAEHGDNLGDVEADRLDDGEEDEPSLAERIRRENEAAGVPSEPKPAAAPQASEHPQWTKPPAAFDGQRLRLGRGPAYVADPLVCLVMQKTEEPGGDRWVPLSCNGVLLQVPRGILVAIPLRYFLVLQHTVREVITQDNNHNEIRRDVPAYPHEIKWMPPRKDIVAWIRRDATLNTPRDRPTKIAA